MKILHFFSNVRVSLKEWPFYNYFFNDPEIEIKICDVLKPGETYPSLYFPLKFRTSASVMDFKDEIQKFVPSILHCHDISILEEILKLGKMFDIPVVFSIYRNRWNDFALKSKKKNELLKNVSMFFVPNLDLKEKVYQKISDVNIPITILGEILETFYSFEKAPITEKKSLLNFASLISEFNMEYISNVHGGLEKILMTGNEMKITWVCFESSFKKPLSKEIHSKKLEKYVSLIDICNFPLLKYEGLITDGNQNKAYSDAQYIHLLLSCIKEGKFLITRKENDLKDILIDGVTCIVLPDFSSNKLGHLIHFFISFQEEITAIADSAKNYYKENHSLTLNVKKFKNAYKQIIDDHVAKL